MMATIETRFDIGQVTWRLRTRKQKDNQPCALCGGTGRVAVEGHPDITVYCPNGSSMRTDTPRCDYGRVWLETETTLCEIERCTIGQVRVQQEADSCRVEYMAWETGVGSGTLLQEDDLFASWSEAADRARELGADPGTDPALAEAIA